MTSIISIRRQVLGVRRRPALLLLALLAAPTAAVTAALLREVVTSDPSATALLLTLAVGGSVLLVVIVARLAGGAITRIAAGAALVWGALAAPTVAAPANALWGEVLAALLGGTPDTGWAGPLTAGPIEESIKLLGVALVAVAWPASIRDARSGLVAGMLIGAGFGGIELAMYLAGPIQAGAVDALPAVGWVFLAREVASGLFLHAAFTGIAGAALGSALGRPSAPRWAGALGALGIAVILHVLANAGPIMPPDLPWGTDDLPSLAIVALVRSAPFAIVIWLLIRLRPAGVRGSD